MEFAQNSTTMPLVPPDNRRWKSSEVAIPLNKAEPVTALSKILGESQTPTLKRSSSLSLVKQDSAIGVGALSGVDKISDRISTALSEEKGQPVVKSMQQQQPPPPPPLPDSQKGSFKLNKSALQTNDILVPNKKTERTIFHGTEPPVSNAPVFGSNVFMESTNPLSSKIKKLTADLGPASEIDPTGSCLKSGLDKVEYHEQRAEYHRLQMEFHSKEASKLRLQEVSYSQMPQPRVVTSVVLSTPTPAPPPLVPSVSSVGQKVPIWMKVALNPPPVTTVKTEAVKRLYLPSSSPKTSVVSTSALEIGLRMGRALGRPLPGRG